MLVATQWHRPILLCMRIPRIQSALRTTATSMSTSPVAVPPTSEGSKPKVLVLAGPTAVGKTRASLALAERLNGEIISADSVQVYKGLDVGSDKISVDERRSIPHHLLDILSPENDFTAGDFYHRARAATQDILSRGRTPIVVGGTGFYLRWFILGKPSTPASTKDSEAVAEAAVQKALQQAEDAAGQPLSADAKWAAAVGLVASLGDEESAQRLSTEVNNWYRLYRVVDILLQSPGRTLAQLNLDEAAPLDYDFRCYFLYRPRMELYRRIDRRVEDMVMNGVVEETGRVLISRGLRPNVNCATRAIGYRQVLEFLEAGAAAEHGPDEAAVVELARSIQGASRKLCHRQLNWFRDDGLFQWVDAERGDDELVDELVRLWNEPAHSGGSGSEHGRLNPDQAKAMKQYVTKMEVLKPKSKEVASALEQAKAVLGTMRGAGAVGEVQPGEEGAVAAKKQKTS